jgi:nascent polypeptide-associated complex subunit beta
MPAITVEQLEKRAAAVRLGGKGSVRRTVKAPHKASGDDKKVQATLKKLGVTPINEVDEAYFIRNDGSAFHFAAPKVQASMQSQCFVVTGNYTTKTAAEVLPRLAEEAKAVMAAHQARAAAGGK